MSVQPNSGSWMWGSDRGPGAGRQGESGLSAFRQEPLLHVDVEGLGINSVKDLVGKKSAPLPEMPENDFPALAAANGIDVNKVTFVNIGRKRNKAP